MAITAQNLVPFGPTAQKGERSEVEGGRGREMREKRGGGRKGGEEERVMQEDREKKR